MQQLSWLPRIDNYVVLMMAICPVMMFIAANVGNTSVAKQELTLYEQSTITKMLRGVTLQISANSFFQSNTNQVCFCYICRNQSMVTYLSNHHSSMSCHMSYVFMLFNFNGSMQMATHLKKLLHARNIIVWKKVIFWWCDICMLST